MVFILLKFALKEFLSDREYKNVSKHTLATYKFSINQFHDYCVQNEIVDVSDVTTSTVRNFLLYCKNDLNNNPTTLNTKLRHLRALFNYLEENEIINSKQNPTRKVSFAKEEIKIEVFTDAQIKQMLGYFQRIKYRDKTFVSYRDHMIIVFLLGTGVRLGELVNLQWKDVNFDNMVITVWGKKREQSSIPMTAKLKKELAEYKLFVDQYFKKETEYVFTTAYSKKLSENAVKCMFKRLKEVMNFKSCRVSAHTFRHTFANKCLLSGMDVFTLQRLLRHSKLDMTMRYVNVFGHAMKEINDRHNPLNSLEI